jgi:hypothetical protein
MSERDVFEELIEHDRQAFAGQQPKTRGALSSKAKSTRLRMVSGLRFQVYFRGPADWLWVSQAAAVGADRVAWLLWRLVGRNKGRVADLKFASDEHMKISRAMKKRQLTALEKAGLVRIKSGTGGNSGRAPVVTLIGLSEVEA